MRRVLFLLGLLAALTGTPLRQAEAAHDLAGSLAELGAGCVLDEVDGGVGDDAGDTVRADTARAPLADPTTEFVTAAVGPMPPLTHPLAARDGNPSPVPSGPSRPRCALLQRFRF